MLSINTNLSSIITQNSMKQSTNKLNEAIERMTTGYKINHAKDNAANYLICTNMSTKISAYEVAQDNTAMGLDMLTTANDTIDEMQNHAERLRALVTQARNGTYGAQSLDAINVEANARIAEIMRLYATTEYNGINLFTRKKIEMADFVSQAKAEYRGFINNPKEYEQSYVDSLTAVSEVEDSFDDSFYKIAEVKDLVKLAELTNAGVDTSGTTFILANDIDLVEYCEEHKDNGGWTPIGNDTNPFLGNFNGNGNIISNLTINRPAANYQGLFGMISDRNLYIKNVGIINADVKGHDRVGGLTGLSNCLIENVFVTGKISGNAGVGGIAGILADKALNNSYSSANVSGVITVGGLIGENYGSLSNNYSNGNVSGERYIGGLAGRIYCTSWIINITNCGAYGNVTGVDSQKACSFIGGFLITGDGSRFGTVNISNSEVSPQDNNFLGPCINAAGTIIDYDMSTMKESIREANLVSITTNLKVGVEGGSSSQIKIDTNFDFDLSEVISDISSDASLKAIDDFINTMSDKQTELGSAQNRLYSALDEISTQYENLLSARSTLRDADMAELSSQYIQQQILQEASATLMATANQSPAIALQLI